MCQPRQSHSAPATATARGGPGPAEPQRGDAGWNASGVCRMFLINGGGNGAMLELPKRQHYLH